MAHGRRAHASAWLLAVIVSVVLLRTSGGDDTLHSAGGFAILGSTQRRTARFGSRAMEAAGRGDCEWAAHLYQRAVSISPADPHVHAVAARHAWEGEGRHDKAEDLLERAMALEPRHPTVALEAARFMMTSSRDAASAEFVLKAAIEHNAGGFLPGLQREHLRFALATAISEQGGRGLEAEQIFREVIDALPAASTSAAASPAGLEAVRVKLHAAALSNLGLLIIARNRNAHGGGNAGDLAEARSLLEKSARMDPSGSAGANLATYLSRGVARDLQGAARPDQASPSQAAQNPDGAAALMRRAAALQETSGFETEERALLERAVALEPNNPGTHAALAYLHQRAGRYAKAEQGYSSALSLDHNHAVALCNKALLFELRGDTQGAADMYRKMCD
ncbi:hypothetical protein T484DRAFT_1777191 [Baffinella frigidus]|nr:hypothetical protein T484DRAFT_1777191 [Cryptophyta sp. CCMP2293]